MDRQPTHEDANLILRLFELRREPRMREARRWFTASFHARTFEDFLRVCPPGSEEHASFRMVATYWEMVASFITRGVLHEEIFFDSGQEMLLVWERVRDLVPEARSRQKNPKAWTNLEQVATRFQAWWHERAPEFYPLFQANIRTAGQPVQPPAPHVDTPHTD